MDKWTCIPENSEVTQNYHWLNPWIFMDFHGFSWIFMDAYVLDGS